MIGAREYVRGSLWTPYEPPAPLDARQLKRARWVTLATLVVGALTLGVALRIPPGDPWFYPATLALAVVWLAGGLAGARPRLGWQRMPDGRLVRPIGSAIAIGLLLVLAFIVGAVVVARIPLLREPVDELLDHAQLGSLPVVLTLTMINGIAEELFFRGTLYDALPARQKILGTIVIYAAVTAASGVPLLVLAGIVLGAVTALQRRASGGVLAPTITHLIWSSSMLLALPPVLAYFD